MLKRTAKKHWTERAGRLYRNAEAIERAPLAYGETVEQRRELAKELRDDADRDVDRRRTMARPRKTIGGQARRGLTVPRRKTGRAQNKRERVACAAAVKAAHARKPEPTGKQKRAAAKVARQALPEYGKPKPKAAGVRT